jgi:hypothetical protein
MGASVLYSVDAGVGGMEPSEPEASVMSVLFIVFMF